MAIDFTLSPELEAIRLRVREFVEQVIKPAEAKIGHGDRVERAGEWPAQQSGQLCNGREHAERVAVHENEPRVGIDRIDRVEGEDMVGAFEHPPALSGLELEVLQKTFVELVGGRMPMRLQPILV